MESTMPDDRILKSLYEQVQNAWAMTQAAVLRTVSAAVSHGENQPLDLLRSLDWGNLAEEIEGLARKDRRELGSRLSVIVEHLAKA
jgi:C4-dicarboxylate-specific signal transduction histidine kinase